MFNQLKDIPKWLMALVIFSIIIALLMLSLYFSKFHFGLAPGQDVWGQFGDYVGGILNPLFSLIGLFALLYTIQLQSKELHESSEHLEKSALALTLQNQVLMRQQFETTFFQMFNLFTEVIKDLELNDTKGRLCLNQLADILKKALLDEKTVAEIKKVYNVFYKENSFLLGHYFRTLYSFIKFIDNSHLDYDDRKFYTNIVRAQLSESELMLLFYSCLCLNDYEQRKFLPLIQRYDLLEYLLDDNLAQLSHRHLLKIR